MSHVIPRRTAITPKLGRNNGISHASHASIASWRTTARLRNIYALRTPATFATCASTLAPHRRASTKFGSSCCNVREARLLARGLAPAHVAHVGRAPLHLCACRRRCRTVISLSASLKVCCPLHLALPCTTWVEGSTRHVTTGFAVAVNSSSTATRVVDGDVRVQVDIRCHLPKSETLLYLCCRARGARIFGCFTTR